MEKKSKTPDFVFHYLGQAWKWWCQRLDEWVIETHEKNSNKTESFIIWLSFFSAESMSRLYLYMAAGLSPDYYLPEQFVSKAFRRPKKTQKWIKLPKFGLSTNSDNMHFVAAK